VAARAAVYFVPDFPGIAAGNCRKTFKNLNNSGKSLIPVHFQQFGEIAANKHKKHNNGVLLLCVLWLISKTITVSSPE
jgi:hypothetical protein